MKHLSRRDQPPPGGFWVIVPQIKAKAQFWDFDSAVAGLEKALKNNLGIHARFPQLPRTRAECEEYVDRTNAERISVIHGAESYWKEGGPTAGTPFSPLQSSPSWAGAAVAAIGRAAGPPAWFKTLGHTATGIKTLAGWLGDGGKPVAAEVSEKRAAVCAACPKNSENVPEHKGNWLNQFDVYASRLIKRQLQERSELKLATTHDAGLGVCLACECPLQLKVHTPLEHVRKHLTHPEAEKLWEKCWVTNEAS